MDTAHDQTVATTTKTAAGPDSGRPDPSDFLGLDVLLTAEERKVREEVRRFVNERIKPNIKEWYERAIFPREIVPEMGELGVLGMHLKGYGCAGRSAVEYGLACMELEVGDSGLRTFVSVQGSLTMSAIHKFGSEEHKQEWLPRMAKGEAIGCFGLTEPEAGSDPASMRTFARKEGSDWVLNGSKRWIGLGTLADVAVVWAQTDDGIRGFVVPTETKGFSATDITHKLSMRASVQCDLFFKDLRLPESAMLPGAKGLGGPFSCLNEARYGIVWGAMGAAKDCYECALEYAKDRIQFGKPIASFQLTQKKLVDMMLEIQKGVLVALRLGRMKDDGTLHPAQISFGKLNNVQEALKIAREARAILGGNGITRLPGNAPRQQSGVSLYLRGNQRDAHPNPGQRDHWHTGLPLTGGGYPNWESGGRRVGGEASAADTPGPRRRSTASATGGMTSTA